jgi:hypothetical protein
MPVIRMNPPTMRWPCTVTLVSRTLVVRVSRRVFQRLLSERPTPERCVESYHLHRTRFERIAERKLRRRQLTDDGNVEITGRDLRERGVRPPTRQIGFVRVA